MLVATSRPATSSGATRLRSSFLPRKLLAPDVRHLHFARRRALFRSQLRIAIVAIAPERRDHVRDLFVARAAAQQFAQVVTAAGEEAEIHLTTGGQARARARAAERLRHRGDDAD